MNQKIKEMLVWLLLVSTVASYSVPCAAEAQPKSAPAPTQRARTQSESKNLSQKVLSELAKGPARILNNDGKFGWGISIGGIPRYNAPSVLDYSVSDSSMSTEIISAEYSISSVADPLAQAEARRQLSGFSVGVYERERRPNEITPKEYRKRFDPLFEKARKKESGRRVELVRQEKYSAAMVPLTLVIQSNMEACTNSEVRSPAIDYFRSISLDCPDPFPVLRLTDNNLDGRVDTAELNCKPFPVTTAEQGLFNHYTRKILEQASNHPQNHSK